MADGGRYERGGIEPIFEVAGPLGWSPAGRYLWRGTVSLEDISGGWLLRMEPPLRGKRYLWRGTVSRGRPAPSFRRIVRTRGRVVLRQTLRGRSSYQGPRTLSVGPPSSPSLLVSLPDTVLSFGKNCTPSQVPGADHGRFDHHPRGQLHELRKRQGYDRVAVGRFRKNPSGFDGGWRKQAHIGQGWRLRYPGGFQREKGASHLRMRRSLRPGATSFWNKRYRADDL